MFRPTVSLHQVERELTPRNKARPISVAKIPLSSLLNPANRMAAILVSSDVTNRATPISDVDPLSLDSFKYAYAQTVAEMAQTSAIDPTRVIRFDSEFNSENFSYKMFKATEHVQDRWFGVLQQSILAIPKFGMFSVKLQKAEGDRSPFATILKRLETPLHQAELTHMLHPDLQIPLTTPCNLRFHTTKFTLQQKNPGMTFSGDRAAFLPGEKFLMIKIDGPASFGHLPVDMKLFSFHIQILMGITAEDLKLHSKLDVQMQSLVALKKALPLLTVDFFDLDSPKVYMETSLIGRLLISDWKGQNLFQPDAPDFSSKHQPDMRLRLRAVIQLLAQRDITALFFFDNAHKMQTFRVSFGRFDSLRLPKMSSSVIFMSLPQFSMEQLLALHDVMALSRDPDAKIDSEFHEKLILAFTRTMYTVIWSSIHEAFMDLAVPFIPPVEFLKQSFLASQQHQLTTVHQKTVIWKHPEITPGTTDCLF